MRKTFDAPPGETPLLLASQPIPPPHPPHVLRSACLAAAAHATDTGDLLDLLTILGIIPAPPAKGPRCPACDGPMRRERLTGHWRCNACAHRRKQRAVSP